MFQFVKIGAAIPNVKISDCTFNKEETIRLALEAHEMGIRVLTFPELSITAYTCGDLFHQQFLLSSCEQAIADIARATADLDMFLLVGAPVPADNQIFNCAVALHKGRILGIVPKTYIPNYSEFYEERWFSSVDTLASEEIVYAGQKVPIGADIIFTAANIPDLKIGVEICEDLWVPIPPSSYLSMYGATLILNQSASNELASKPGYRRELVGQQSSRCLNAYVYASSGIGESTQDAVFSGHSLIYEDGHLLAESESFLWDSQIIKADIDLELLMHERRRHSTFMNHTSQIMGQQFYREISFDMKEDTAEHFDRDVDSHPFTPMEDESLAKRCQNIFSIQATGLARRFDHTHAKTLVIGISGGLDSTLALLVCVKACDTLGISREHVLGITMPGFGTTDRTYQNALQLMASLGISTREIPIRDAVIQHFKDIEHDQTLHNVTYENSQARERTQILMDIANQTNGLVVGTGDLSELALGWATYNGDHMSMYGVNSGVPKTLVRVLVKWAASQFDEKTAALLMDIYDTPISPELLPPDKDGKIEQKTEDLVGPYELHDFFIYQVLRFGFSPAKVLFLAEKAFVDSYDRETLLKWLRNFYRRFFAQQFKRSCLPDGPKIGNLCLSPRSDWRMPSDATSRIWLDEMDRLS